MTKSKADAKNTTAEYCIEKYKFMVESKFAERGQRLEDIIIKLAVDSVKKAKNA